MTTPVVPVVTTQFSAVQTRNWSTGVFGCFEDIESCLFGFFCPFCSLFSLSRRMSENCCLPVCPGSLFAMRTKLRIENGIQGTLCNDAMCSLFCSPCVSCQLSRELNAIGR